MRIVAVAGWSWEPEWLVDQLRENLSWCDELVLVDDRARFAAGLPWRPEGEYRQLQRAACEAAGADWVLVTSPDERWEARAGRVLRQVCETGLSMACRMPLRSLWTPTAYRVDGVWGRMGRRARLWRLLPGQRMSTKGIHCPPQPVHPPLPIVDVDVTIYDLKTVEPANRVTRQEAYAAAERAAGVRRAKWPRLYAEAGLELAEIPPERGYSPGYRPFTFPGWPATEAR